MKVETNNLYKIPPNKDLFSEFLAIGKAWFKNQPILQDTYNDLHASVSKSKHSRR